MNPEVTTLAFESFIKTLNEKCIKSNINTNVIIGDTHYMEYMLQPKIHIESITIDFVVYADKIKFKD